MNKASFTKFVNLQRTDRFSYCDPVIKDSMHRAGKSVLREIAKSMNLKTGEYNIRSNMGGIEVSGEITLHANDFYLQINPSSCMTGKEILLRSCKGLKDYSGGVNHFLSIEDLNDPEKILRTISNVRGT